MLWGQDFERCIDAFLAKGSGLKPLLQKAKAKTPAFAGVSIRHVRVNLSA